MAKFDWYKGGGPVAQLDGENLSQILNKKAADFCRHAEIGSAAGARIVKAVAERARVGDKEACRLTITAQGWPMAGDVDTQFGPEKSGSIMLLCNWADFEEGELPIQRRGGARPGSGAKPKEDGAKEPITERFPPIVAAYIKCQAPGYLTRLVEADMRRPGKHHDK